MFSTEIFDTMYTNPEWEGFGYLGERRREANSPEEIAEADQRAIAVAESLGMTEAQLFAWANSKIGRWYGDAMFGCAGRHAERYLPGSVVTIARW